ncbi:MAG: ATP synthase F1 subunit delta [Deltaproteobacteria bacterium]|nr:ATP synthase F1 subunit delta [Deltaproteobacteria bacterium]
MIRDIIAKRYARAYFALVREQGRLLEAQSELNDFVAFLGRNDELNRVLCNPVFEVAERKAVLKTLIEKLEVSKELGNLLFILLEKNKIAYAALVSENFARLVDEAEGRAKVALTSAAELDETTLAELQKEFSRLTGKKVELDVEVDESLIGGIVARYGGMVYDGSIKTQLQLIGECLRG